MKQEEILLILIDLELNRQGKLHLLVIEKSKLIEKLIEARNELIEMNLNNDRR